MEQHKQESTKLNSNAPPELSRWSFLIGKYRCEAKLKREGGTWESLKATWEGRYILEGYAIADDYRMETLEGELLVLGTNFRSYDSKRKSWTMKWLNALSGAWTDIGSDELGGIKIDEKTISYSMKEPVAQHAFTRATYINIAPDHFTWKGEKSNDGKVWEEFLVIEAYREKNSH